MTRGIPIGVAVLACSLTLLLSACQIDSLAIPDLAGGGTGGTLIDMMGGSTGGDNMGGVVTGGVVTGGEPTGGMMMTTEVVVDADITQNEIWDSNNVYILNTIVYVEDGVELTIRPGTVIKGNEGSALIVRAGGRIRAQGSQQEPIVFTSAKEPGTRAPGDWGGVALLGRAPVNEGTNGPDFNNGFMVLEGVTDQSRVIFGGTDESHSCGILEYARIEFAGFKLNQNDELNGLTLGGCGYGTSINYVQVHKGSDDGVEIFGGHVFIRHILISSVEDDSLDWDRGWVGGGQFIAIYQSDAGDNGIEADSGDDLNEDGINDGLPLSAPHLFNMTIAANRNADWGAVFKAGTAGLVRNSIFVGQLAGGIDIEGTDTAGNVIVDAMMPPDPALVVDNSLFFNHGEDGNTPFPAEAEDDDGGLDEDMYFRDPAFNNTFQDPMLTDLTSIGPNTLVPLAPNSPIFTITAAEFVYPSRVPFSEREEQFPFETANYIGALDPNNTPWTATWTDFPEN